MAKTTLNTEVKEKTLAEINETAAAQLKDPTVDPEVVAAVEASKAAAEAHIAAAEDRKKNKGVLNDQMSMDNKRPSVGESAELIAAVKADAEKRNKTFSVCPISGVLVVG